MLFINFSSEITDSFKSKYRELAELYKGDGLSFLMADIDVNPQATKVHNPLSLYYQCDFEGHLFVLVVCVGLSFLVTPT